LERAVLVQSSLYVQGRKQRSDAVAAVTQYVEPILLLDKQNCDTMASLGLMNSNYGWGYTLCLVAIESPPPRVHSMVKCSQGTVGSFHGFFVD